MDDYKNWLEAIPDMVLILDNNGIIIDCNERQATHIGFKKEEIVGINAFDLVAKESQQDAIKSFEKLKDEEKVMNVQVFGLKKDGSKFHALSSTSKLTDKNGNFTGYLIVTKDITEIESIKKEIKDLKIQKFSMIGELTSRISHDLKNSLSVIKLAKENFEMKHENHFDEKDKATFSRMDNGIESIKYLVNDVLNYVKISSPLLENTSILSLLSQSIDSITIPEKITINLPQKEITVSCDPKRIEVVFVNLIVNAIQAMDNNGIIDIRFSEENNTVKLEFENSGSGIPQQNISKIFDPLFTTKNSGTGLGLSSVKSIIESHGGTISVTSPPTIFTITLSKIQ